jgi:hypothetical protein
MNAKVSVRFKTRVMNADGSIARERPWEKNLILDQGLNGMANSAAVSGCRGNPAGCFTNLFVGGGTNPNSVTSGAITFTQTLTQITASAPIFTLAMVGQLFKWGTGTGGVETYILSFIDNQNVTVDTSASVGATVGTIWNVTQTTLQTPSHVATSYQTLAGNNSKTQSGNTVTYQRYFIVPQQALVYTVNEIGYNSTAVGTAAGNCVGRFVLSSSDVVANTQYYLVIMQVQATYTPSNPAAQTNVGTNINVAGTIMVETLDTFAIQDIASTGLTVGAEGTLDCQQPGASLFFSTVTYSQNGSITGAAGPNWSANKLSLGGGAILWAYASLRGTMQMSFTNSITTAGQTLYGIGISQGTATDIVLDVKFTTPQTAPVGLFQPDTVWQIVFHRILSN